MAIMLLFFLVSLLMSSAHAADGTDAFLKRHWVRPIPPQGKAPKSFTAIEASLQPSACGTCHTQQYQDWRNSLHGHAMGDGIMGQLLVLKPNATSEIRSCTICHAPLAEQEASLKKQLRGIKQDNALHEQGLICAACHVRRNVRYGPPSNLPVSEASKPHDGFVANAAFEDGRFCATCHQFGADGYTLNGKPLENTYAEWQASPYAQQNKQCQSCHMPQRQHLWRGIHDAEMTRSGVTIKASEPTEHNGEVSAQLTVTNSGTGHYFPTYVTPRVIIKIYQTASDKHLIEGTMQEKIIGRLLSSDMAKELADTRLAPNEDVSLNYQVPRHPQAKELVYQIIVEPDYFYSGVFRALLSEQQADKGTAAIRKALSNSLSTPYDLFKESYELK